jgi:hypothetical protein
VAVFRITVEGVTILLVEKIFEEETDNVDRFIIAVECVTTLLVDAIF